MRHSALWVYVCTHIMFHRANVCFCFCCISSMSLCVGCVVCNAIHMFLNALQTHCVNEIVRDVLYNRRASQAIYHSCVRHAICKTSQCVTHIFSQSTHGTRAPYRTGCACCAYMYHRAQHLWHRLSAIQRV